LSNEEIMMRKNMQLLGDEEGLQYYFKTEETEGNVLGNSAVSSPYQGMIINPTVNTWKTGTTGFMIYGCESPHWNVWWLITGETDKTDVPHLMIMPNPNNGSFKINFSLSMIDDVDLVIYNMLGKAVYAKKYRSALAVQDHLNLNFLEAGTYLLELKTGRYQSRKLFVIQ